MTCFARGVRTDPGDAVPAAFASDNIPASASKPNPFEDAASISRRE
jgi:hypothetical protein